ncbi:serpin family protein [Nodularia spumigena]|jgi:serine protease inhibitor|uniref:Serpin family protein n=1 Tax=Nodularia spumigena UHCC 0060 TaxID=3110300 RepID=A0ABU5UQ53_NODSP|nr:serpin family protein [Nodularia spumigena]MEA5524227.1 serpin family protein [Nodularia spumigena UHCC 0143]MEA5558093.1 serpin family protein [Nodularia spumigena CH309]MEA5608405.1 serpin family protein [Nodularia spumigena UHCC 0060]MEA5614294.1 serpin family protein [Nodularia spumigena UHCC 0040]
MNRQKLSGVEKKFLQRRYGVSLGRRYVLAAASVVLFGVLGCSQVSGNTNSLTQSEQPYSETRLPKKTLISDAKLVDANNKFGFKLFSEIWKNHSSQDNIFVSPSSVAIALAMVYNGASGSTQQAMAKTLELQGMSLPEINSAYATLKELLENPDPQVQLTIANSLWANQEATLQPNFLQSTQEFYKAKVTNLDFKDAASANTINEWVKDSTRGKINKIVEKIEPDQVLFLINAIYFKGKWSNQFDKSQTAKHPFTSISGEQKQHPMMSQTGEYRYYENDQFQAVSLPYGEDGKVSFYIFLPKEESNLQTFSENLNFDNWEKWLSQFRNRDGFIRLPRFKTDYDVTLNDALKALGMAEAFTNQANFSGMGKNLKISEVKHKTFVEVNEEGTEAAAATSVGMVPTSFREKPEPFRMIVDRPFFSVIRDNQTGSILFMGSITDPQ